MLVINLYILSMLCEALSASLHKKHFIFCHLLFYFMRTELKKRHTTFIIVTIIEYKVLKYITC